MGNIMVGIGLGMILSVFLLAYKLDECKARHRADLCAVELGWPNAKFIAVSPALQAKEQSK